VVDDRDPVTTGSALRYTVSYANRGTIDVLGATLQLKLPPGTGFAAADEGGVEAGGMVSWSLGDLAPGAGGERHVDVQVTGLAGTILTTVAETSDALARRAGAAATTVVSGTTPLRLSQTSYVDSARPSEEIVYELTVANTGASNQTVTLTTLIPQEMSGSAVDDGDCPGSFCENGELVTWNLGTIAPGQHKTRRLIGPVGGSERQGELVHAPLALASSGSAEARAGRAFRVDSSGRMQVAITESRDPIVTGAALRYVLSYANRGTIDAPGVVLRQVLPGGADFVNADGGGSHAGGIVTWAIGTVPPGAGGQRVVDVHVPAGPGTVLLTEAETRDDFDQRATTTTTTIVAPSSPLRVTKTTFPNPPRPNEEIVALISVGNTGATPLTVSLTDVLPQEFNASDTDGGTCAGSFCEATEVVTWDLGTLSAGQVVTRKLVGRVGSGARNGELVDDGRTRAVSGAIEARAAAAYRINAAQDVQLGVTADQHAVVSGALQYTVTFANRGTTDVPGIILRQTLPSEVAFSGTNGGGTHDGGVVTWTIGTLAPGAAGQRTVDVTVGAPAGTILVTHADAADGFGRLALASTSSVVLPSVPLTVTKTRVGGTAEAGGSLTYDITVTNSGASPQTVTLTDVIADEFSSLSAVDGGTCPGSFCEDTERVTWSLGTLNPGQQATRQITGTLDGSLRTGEIVRNTATARAGANEARATVDVPVAP
jgi:uncharacterized repeat protein (TIGR01451 family)